MTGQSVITEVRDHVGILRIDRQARMNALTPEVFAGLREGLDRFEADGAVRCVMLTGAGRAFCAGQDLGAELPRMADGGIDIGHMLERDYNPMVMRLQDFPKPVVAAVNGAAVGAGANLALACDIVVAASGAYFQQAFGKIGLMPDAGGTWLLPRIVGMKRAQALMLTADPVPAAEAERFGMVYKVFADDGFEAAALSFALSLAEASSTALRATRTALAASATNTLSQQLDMERNLQSGLGRTADFQEGVKAFLEKRQPRFG